MMAGQQAMAGAFRASNLGGYDSDVEGGNAGNPAGMESTFSDKAVSSKEPETIFWGKMREQKCTYF